jgi:hypothetical protein
MQQSLSFPPENLSYEDFLMVVRCIRNSGQSDFPDLYALFNVTAPHELKEAARTPQGLSRLRQLEKAHAQHIILRTEMSWAKTVSTCLGGTFTQ